MSSRGGKPPGIFFAADAAPRPGGVAPAPYAAAPGPLGRPRSFRAQSALRPGPPPWRLSPPAPKGGGLGQLMYAAGRVQAGPVLARPRPPPPQSQRPGLVRPRPVGPRRRWCWLVAGGGAPGPWSACVRSRCWPPGCGGPQPPRRGALGRGGGGPAAGCGRLGVGLAALPASVPRLRLTRPPPAGAPPAARRRDGGGPLSGARPWFSLGWFRPPLGGPKAPRPRPLPNARARRHDAARATGVWCLAACGRRWTRGGGNRRPKIIFPTNAAPRRHRDIGNSCASYS